MPLVRLAAGGAVTRVFVTTGSSLLIQLVTLGSGVALARGLEPTGRGELAVAMQWPLILAALAGLGVSDGVAFYSARANRQPTALLPTALGLGVFQSAVAVGVGWFLLPKLLASSSADVVQGALLYLLIIPLHPPTLYPVAVLQAANDLRAFNLARSLPHLGYTAVLAVLWLVGQLTVGAALVASLVATSVTAVACIGLAARDNALTWSFDTGLVRNILAFGWKVYLGQVAGLIAARADIVVLSVFSSATVVGLYVAANTVGAAAAVIPTSLAMVLYPMFARLEPATVPEALARLVWLGVIFLCIAVGLTVVVLPPLMVVLLGESFHAAEGIARIAGLAVAVKGCNLLLATVLRGIGKPLQSSFSDLLATALFVVLLLVLVPQLAATGAALAALVSALSGSAIALAYLARSTALSPATVAVVARRDLARLLSRAPRRG